MSYLRSNAPIARKLRAMELAGAFKKTAPAPAPETWAIPDPEPCIPPPIKRPPPMKRSKRIFLAALEYFGMPENVMCGPSRGARIVFARQVAIYAIYSECAGNESTVSVCKMFNKKDHTTVVHAVQKIRELYEAGDAKVVAAVDFLRVVQ